MTLWRTIGEVLAHWTDTVATGVIVLAGRFFSPRVVRLVEDDKPDTFALEGAGKAAGDPQRVTFVNGRFGGAELASFVKGSRLELVLRPSRFLVRPLELPARANEFIEGIVRVQIDRLTPWTAAEAVFGCGTPVTACYGSCWPPSRPPPCCRPPAARSCKIISTAAKPNSRPSSPRAALRCAST